MKKLFDSKFLFIVALSLVVLIILGVLAFYLFDDKDATFVRNGYVINPLSGKVEKYFFNKDTPYKENLSSMIVFNDVDKKKATILKDSFLHYNDGSLSFLTNGAILDLDTINDTKAVSFYNITSSSIIEKTGDKYVIKNAGDDVNLKNFIGRISEDKYIIVGKLEAKIPGNEKTVTGDYFEIVYSEKGIVNIENKDVKFQVTAEGTVIYANGVSIDLGAKKISKNGQDVMSLTAITINGDENIEIIPEPDETEEGGEGNGGEGPENNGNEEGNGEGQGGGNGGGAGGTEKEVNKTKDIVVSLKDASIGSTSVDVTFDMYNTKSDDAFTLQVTNLESGRTVDIINGIVENKEMRVNLLSPNTKYLFTVTNDRDGNKYFQKIFETSDFGIRLEKTFATDSELGFRVTVDKNTDITDAKLTLYKYNEKTKKNEIVTTSYYDNVTNETKYSEKVTYLSSTKGNIEGVHNIVYDELDSNTIYTAVLDEFSLVSVNFKDVYNITETAMTLKKAPEFSNMTAVKNIASGTFSLSLKDIVDEDNAIESYTYRIYEVNNPSKLAIDPITKSNASPIEVKMGDKANQLRNDTNYFYKVIIEYYDNEKYVEYILDDTINFIMGKDPYITVVPNESKISYDRIGATIYLIDNSCLIPMPGREKCIGPSSTRINVTTMTSNGLEYVYSGPIDFEVVGDEIKYEFEKDGLQAGTTYTISIEAVRNDDINAGTREILNTDESRQNITTKTLTNFAVRWTDKGSSANHVVNVDTRLIARNGTGTLSPEETAAIIKKVDLTLYNGSYVDNYESQDVIGAKTFVNSSEFNIKEHFYDKGYVITSDETFGLTIDDLRRANGGQLSEYYTVVIKAYYDNDNVNEVVLSENAVPYRISPLLLMEDIEDPDLHITPRSKNVVGVNELNEDLINPGTTVGYLVNARWDSTGMSSNDLNVVGVNLYVYNDKGEKVSFYVKSGDEFVKVNGIVKESVTSATDFYEKEIFMDYGTDYETKDTDVMRRGNSYYIGYQLVINCSAGEVLYPTNNNRNVPDDFGKYSSIIRAEKETPNTTMYIDRSTANSITYKYTVKDPDNALYKYDDNEFYYYLQNEDVTEKKPVIEVDTNNTDDKKYAGTLTINGLSKGDTYQLYYKKNVYKTGSEATDILNYFDGADDGKRLFDGEYNSSSFKNSNYRLKYEVINPMQDNKVTDNKVTIKFSLEDGIINPTEEEIAFRNNKLRELLDRVVSYELVFKDMVTEEVKPINLWKLETCSGDTEQDVPRCFSVDYITLKSMKNHEITVTVNAYYDTGITGYGYTIGEGQGFDYEYMIFQNNLVPGTGGKYVVFTGSDTIELWDPTKNVAKGYYTYTNNGGNVINYTSILYNRDRPKPINVALTGSGYSTSYGILNPKMVSNVELECVVSGENKFKFDSIAPKVKIDRTVRRIDGAVLTLSLSGADIEDFCAAGSPTSACDNTGNVYLYVDVWSEDEVINANASRKTDDEGNDLRARPTVQSIEINKERPTAQIKAYVDKLSAGNKYYYNVYAYMNNDGHPIYTQLPDYGEENAYTTKTYSFTALSASYIYNNFSVSYRPDMESDNYNAKLMTTTINLYSYTNSEPFNFDIGYAICEKGADKCTLEDNENILKGIINYADVKVATTHTTDITSKNLVFGKEYHIEIMAMYEDYYWDENTHTFKTKPETLELNPKNKKSVTLSKLRVPDFTVERKAVYVNEEYAIDITVTIKDDSRVLNGGDYYVALRDPTNSDPNTNMVGTIKVLDGDNYVDAGTNKFSASEIQKHIRITGLQENTKYTVEVYGQAFINNYDIPTDERNVTISKTHTVYSTNSSGVAFGNDLLFSATANSFVVTFLGGSNFDNVTHLTYTIGLWDGDPTTEATYSGEYDIGTGQGKKSFEFFQDTGYWYFRIDKEGIHNALGDTYRVKLIFDVLNSAEPYVFEGDVQYVEENK